jgi:GNAT superfamily N-acetyltransferase
MKIKIGFSSTDARAAEKDTFWARPSFAPDHVDDEAIGEQREGEGSSSADDAMEIELLFAVGSYHTLCRGKGKGAAEAVETVAAPLPGGYTTDESEWARQVADTGDSEPLCGAEIGVLPDGARVRCVDLRAPDTVAFVMRLTNAMMWLIDGCTPIEIEDEGERWRLFTVWRERELVAAATCFTFVFPIRRLRVCQFLVSPRHQRHGYGAALLEAIYTTAANDQVVEVNVEDPSDGFTALRDYVDARRAVGLRALVDAAEGAPPSAAQLAAAQKELLLTKEQAHRVAELLRLRHLDELASDEALGKFRIECKKRLLKAHEETLAPLEIADRKRKLGDMFDAAAQAYRSCAKKLA